MGKVDPPIQAIVDQLKKTSVIGKDHQAHSDSRRFQVGIQMRTRENYFISIRVGSTPLQILR
jgi:hypothetical protein